MMGKRSPLFDRSVFFPFACDDASHLPRDMPSRLHASRLLRLCKIPPFLGVAFLISLSRSDAIHLESYSRAAANVRKHNVGSPFRVSVHAKQSSRQGRSPRRFPSPSRNKLGEIKTLFAFVAVHRRSICSPCLHYTFPSPSARLIVPDCAGCSKDLCSLRHSNLTWPATPCHHAPNTGFIEGILQIYQVSLPMSRS